MRQEQSVTRSDQQPLEIDHVNDGMLKINPLTYGVDAIRQAFLQAMPGTAGIAATPGIEGMPPPPTGVTVLGHTMTLMEDAAVVTVLGAALVIAAAVAFSRRD